MKSDMKNETKHDRRKFIGASAAVMVSSPLVALVSRLATAAEAPPVDPDSAQAKALAYVHESTVAGAWCRNCQLYTGSPDASWGPCALFPGRQVATAGWCNAWVEKTG